MELESSKKISATSSLTILSISSTHRRCRKKLRLVYSQVGKRVVYSILQEVLNYFCMNKPKAFEKPVMSIFADIHFLIKWLRASIAPNRNIWYSIAIVIVFDSLHNDFRNTIKNILEWEDKTINEIQQIFASTKGKFISKRIRGVTGDLTMMSRSRNLAKQKASSKDKYFNYRKLSYQRRDCTLLNYRKQKNNQKKSITGLHNQHPRHKNYANIATTTINKVNSNPSHLDP